MEYNAKLEMPYTECVNFKEKESHFLSSVLLGGHLIDYCHFGGYHNISFGEDDIKCMNPIITSLESFSRNKTNCLCFNLTNSIYDKLFIYKTGIKESNFYGLILYNIENNKSLNIYNIEYDVSKLVITINRIITNKLKK